MHHSPMRHALHGFCIERGIEAALAIASLARVSEPQGSKLLEVQVDRLIDDTPESRAAEAALLAETGPGAPRYRSQFSFYGFFEECLTVVHDGPRDHVFVYDDDIVSLDDSLAPADRRRNADPWDANVAARDQLVAYLLSRQHERPTTLRVALH